MDPYTTSQKVVRNTIFNTIGRFWQILIGLILTPYIVSHIGMERYGIWAIVGVLTGYFGLLDLGVKDSFTKYIAEFYAKEDDKSINEVVNVGFVFYSLLALIVVAVGFFSLDPLIRLFKIPTNLHDETSFVFLLGIILFAASNVVNVFAAIQSGLQRMDVSNKVAVAISLPSAIGTIVFLQLGYGLPGLMVNSAIIMGIGAIAHILIAFKILPTFRFNPFMFNKRIFKMLFSFGVKRWVTQIEQILSFQTDKLLIAHFLTLDLVGFYQLGFFIISQAKQFLRLITSAAIPAVSELHAKERKEKIVEFYFRGTKYAIIAVAPTMVLLFVTAHLIMTGWMGLGYQMSELVIQILAASSLISVMTMVASVTTIGMGKPGFQMEAGGGQAIINLILSIILVIKIGFAGVVIATLISTTLSSIYFMVRTHNFLEISLVDLIRKTMNKPVIVSFMLGLVIYLFNFVFNDLTVSRFSSLALLISEATIFLGGYFLILWKMRFFGIEDNNMVKVLSGFWKLEFRRHK